MDIVELAKRRGFFWPAFELYGGGSGFYVYGPLGALLKLRIEGLIRDFYINEERCILLDEPILTTQKPWIASGHTASFTDMTIECEKCGEAYRADHLVEERTGTAVEGMTLSHIHKLIVQNNIRCPKCGGQLGSVQNYNLMFSTTIGPGKNKAPGYLRPETATTTYIDFRRLFNLGRSRLPLGVLQIGKSFRNEISPRTALVRLREFHQAEIQFFLNPQEKDRHPRFSDVARTEITVLTKHDQVKNRKPSKMTLDTIAKKISTEWIAYHLGISLRLFEAMGIDRRKLRLRQHRDDERSFYSSDTWDVEFLSSNFGRVELVGVADRGDYDLKRHQKVSGQKLDISADGKRFTPHVIEVAYGIDRPLLCIMESTLREDGNRTYLSLPAAVAPYQVTVLPLVKKGGLPEKARDVYNRLKREGFYVLYDEEYVGKAYYRQDEIGTLFCVTCDYDSLTDNAVTIRSRDDKKQVRVAIDKLPSTLRQMMTGGRGKK